MTVVVWICGILVLAGGLMAIVRAEIGPSILDRSVALDILVTTLVAGVALYAAIERRSDVVPVLVALSVVGFVGSVAVARFVSSEPPGEGRVLTRWEAALAKAIARAQEWASEDLDDLDTDHQDTDRQGTNHRGTNHQDTNHQEKTS
ncbi:MAG: monovalent cation/H+ antiporter complex subunit F [Micrococcales bacterium]|nr:monovalent cation/H+ antiporter complex subunit F [Micrococcales bacterium]MCL2668539.1 monovalent cation/H+ antiporter complex subunit F [Micrococcales bacterium]